jgi:glycerophosphoryl diester phosphodiesterase
VLLAFHDSVLDRVTDRGGAVAELTHAQVREARVGGREQVPTLAELLDAFPEARFNIDLKSDAAVEALADLVAARGEWDRLLVGSFSWPRLQRFRRLTGGRVPTSATPVEALAFVVLPSGRLADLVTRGRVAALQVPHRRTLRVAGRRITVPVVTAGVVRRAHAAGKHVHVWTIDDPEEMRELLDLGVDGLFTDRTDPVGDPVQDRVVEGQEDAVPRRVHVGLEVAVAQLDRVPERRERVLQPLDLGVVRAPAVRERDHARARAPVQVGMARRRW